MTDLKNGIIDINGYEIHAGTTPEDIKKNLEGIYCHYNKIPTGEIESFLFEKVFISNCMFTIKLSFYLGKLDSIKLESHHVCEGEHTWKKVFELNNRWLEKELGNPDTIGLYSRGYHYNTCYVRSMYLADSRWGDESFIDIRFGE